MIKTPSPQINAVIFDIGNVLVRWDPRLAYAPLFQGREEDLDYFLNEVCSLDWHTRHDQGMSFRDNIRNRQQEFPEYADMIARFETEWDNMFDGVIEGTVDLLYQLRDRHYPLFGLTNFAAGKYTDFCRKYSFMSLFEDVIVSGVEKVTKPDPRIYRILLDRTAIAAERTLFIDDRQENLRAAEKFGLQTHLFIDAETLAQDMADRGILPGPDN